MSGLFCAEREALESGNRAGLVCLFQVVGNRELAVLNEFLIEQAGFFVEFVHTACCNLLDHVFRFAFLARLVGGNLEFLLLDVFGSYMNILGGSP